MSDQEKLYSIDEWARRTVQRPEAVYAAMSGATPSIKPAYKPGSSQVFVTPTAAQGKK